MLISKVAWCLVSTRIASDLHGGMFLFFSMKLCPLQPKLLDRLEFCRTMFCKKKDLKKKVHCTNFEAALCPETGDFFLGLISYTEYVSIDTLYHSCMPMCHVIPDNMATVDWISLMRVSWYTSGALTHGSYKFRSARLNPVWLQGSKSVKMLIAKVYLVPFKVKHCQTLWGSKYIYRSKWVNRFCLVLFRVVKMTVKRSYTVSIQGNLLHSNFQFAQV